MDYQQKYDRLNGQAIKGMSGSSLQDRVSPGGMRENRNEMYDQFAMNSGGGQPMSKTTQMNNLSSMVRTSGVTSN